MSGSESSLGDTEPKPQSDAADGRRGGVKWCQVATLYRRELRSAFREKAIVFNSILIPLFLYPFILWVAFTGLLFVQGQTEGALSRVAVTHWPKGHPALRRRFERDKKLQLIEIKDRTAGLERITNGTLDALVEFLPPAGASASLLGNFQAHVILNESKERSITARKRVSGLIEDYRSHWLDREARTLGIDPDRWQRFTVSTRNTASKKQMGAFFLGLMLPLLFVATVAVGCFYPAVDATAGERERNTWETLMSTATNRMSIVTAKYLYVVTLGGLAGVLNLTGLLLTLKPIFRPLLARAGDVIQFTLPLAALPVIALAAVLLAGFVAAGMMIFASFARTFKEGQALITPFYLMVMLPILFLQEPGLKFSLPLAWLPIANVMLMVRAAISNSLSWLEAGVTTLVSLALIALCLWLATGVLRYEDVVVGSYRGGVLKFFRNRLLRPMRTTRSSAEARQ